MYRWFSISRVHRDGEVVLGPRGPEFTARIVAELLDARRVCPTYGPLYGLAGQLEASVLDDPASANRHLTQAFQLAQCDSGACYFAARQQALDGRLDESTRTFARYLDLSGSFNDVISVYVNDANRPDLAMALARGNRERLGSLAAALARHPEHEALAKQAGNEALELLKQIGRAHV